jgi:hypothetical protein
MTQLLFLQEEHFVGRKAELKGFDRLLLPETTQAVMLIEADEKMGKSWLAAKLNNSFVAKYAEMPSVYIDFDNPLDKAKLTDHLAFIRILRNRIKFPEYFVQLNAIINQQTENQPVEKISEQLATLSDEIQAHYTLDELERMARYHNVDWENFVGSKFKRTYSMVHELYGRKELNLLYDRLRSERANVDWEPYIQKIASMQTSKDDDRPGESGGDEGRALVAMSAPDQQRAEDKIDEAFFNALAHLLEDKPYLTFLFDSIDKATTEAYRFIEKKLIPHLLDERLRNMIIVITGRIVPDPSESHVKPFIIPPRKLKPFTIDDITEYMAARNIEEQPPDFTWKGLHWASGGVPGELALMADRLQVRSSQTDSFYED